MERPRGGSVPGTSHVVGAAGERGRLARDEVQEGNGRSDLIGPDGHSMAVAFFLFSLVKWGSFLSSRGTRSDLSSEGVTLTIVCVEALMPDWGTMLAVMNAQQKQLPS